jgi:hypothetical protein
MAMVDYLWWSEKATIPTGKVRADMTITYTEVLVTHGVAVGGGEANAYTACGRLVPTAAAVGRWSDAGAVCRVCRRKIREARWS